MPATKTLGQREPAAGRFGPLLRRWRQTRRLSQLDLAVEAEVSSKHVSFLETGRSTPSRQMVLRLADVLDVPLRHRNTLLQAAGFSPRYRERDLEDEALEPIRASIEKLLERHDPFPTVLTDRHWFIKLSNRGAARLLARLVAPHQLEPPLNSVRLLLDPHGLRPWVVNWEEVAGAMIQRLHREIAVNGGDPAAVALLEEVLASPGIPSDSRFADLGSDLAVIVPLHIRKEDLELRFFSAITTLGTALDVTLHEMVIETFLPADDETDRAMHELAAGDDGEAGASSVTDEPATGIP